MRCPKAGAFAARALELKKVCCGSTSTKSLIARESKKALFAALMVLKALASLCANKELKTVSDP